MADFYLWFKAAHIISFVSWMAALLYLPRLFVYHTSAPDGSIQSKTFKTMERRLLKIIMNPAMIATWVFGIALLLTGTVNWQGDLWIYSKLALVIILSVFHMRLARHVKDFAGDVNTRTERYFRKINEVPAVIMILVVILVVVKPF